MDGLPQIRDFLFSLDYPWIAFAATSGGVYRTVDGGRNWSRVFGEPMERLTVDPENSHVLYAVGVKGIYKSVDLGEREMGTLWNSLCGQTPSTGDKAFAVESASRTREIIYADPKRALFERRNRFGMADSSTD